MMMNNFYNMGGPAPDTVKLINLANECRRNGAYLSARDDQMTTIYNFIKTKSAAITIDKGSYAEDLNSYYFVVYFTCPIDVFYQNTKYSIYIKVLIPPSFPQYPPILSIINIDPVLFTINPVYAKDLLPDETFAVTKLVSADNWAFSNSFPLLLEEMIAKLSQVFPFFRTQKQVPKAEPPKFYPRPALKPQANQFVSNFGAPVNDFGYGSPAMPSQFNQQQFYGNPGSQMNNGQPPYYQNAYNNGYSNNQYNPNQPMQPPAPVNTGPSSQTLSTMGEILNGMVISLKKEMDQEKECFKELSRKRTENKLICSQSHRYYVTPS
jgi:hypothetical protein